MPKDWKLILDDAEEKVVAVNYTGADGIRTASFYAGEQVQSVIDKCRVPEPAAEPRSAQEAVCQCGVAESVHTHNEGHSFTPYHEHMPPAGDVAERAAWIAKRIAKLWWDDEVSAEAEIYAIICEELEKGQR